MKKQGRRVRVRKLERHMEEDGHPEVDWEEREVPEGGSVNEEKTND